MAKRALTVEQAEAWAKYQAQLRADMDRETPDMARVKTTKVVVTHKEITSKRIIDTSKVVNGHRRIPVVQLLESEYKRITETIAVTGMEESLEYEREIKREQNAIRKYIFHLQNNVADRAMLCTRTDCDSIIHNAQNRRTRIIRKVDTSEIELAYATLALTARWTKRNLPKLIVRHGDNLLLLDDSVRHLIHSVLEEACYAVLSFTDLVSSITEDGNTNMELELRSHLPTPENLAVQREAIQAYLRKHIATPHRKHSLASYQVAEQFDNEVIADLDTWLLDYANTYGDKVDKLLALLK